MPWARLHSPAGRSSTRCAERAQRFGRVVESPNGSCRIRSGSHWWRMRGASTASCTFMPKSTTSEHDLQHGAGDLAAAGAARHERRAPSFARIVGRHAREHALAGRRRGWARCRSGPSRRSARAPALKSPISLLSRNPAPGHHDPRAVAVLERVGERDTAMPSASTTGSAWSRRSRPATGRLRRGADASPGLDRAAQRRRVLLARRAARSGMPSRSRGRRDSGARSAKRPAHRLGHVVQVARRSRSPSP